MAEAALDLVVPQRCAGCGRDRVAWCAACRVAVADAPIRVPGPLPAWAAAPHTGPAGRAVAAFKDGGAHRLATPLAALLAGAVRAVLEGDAVPDRPPPGLPIGPVWLVPVPARRAARRSRGADHLRELSRLAARSLRRQGLPAHRLDLLRHVRDSRDQVGLGRAERAINVAGTLAAGPVPAGIVVVVDDVTTTGATLAEAARALRVQAPGRSVHGAAITWAGPPSGARARLASPGIPD